MASADSGNPSDSWGPVHELVVMVFEAADDAAENVFMPALIIPEALGKLPTLGTAGGLGTADDTDTATPVEKRLSLIIL